MKKIILLLLIQLYSVGSYSNNKDKSITSIELYAISFLSFYYIPPTINDIKERGIYVRVSDSHIIENLAINDLLGELIEDKKNERNLNLDSWDIRLIMIVNYDDTTKDSYYLTTPSELRIIKNNKSIYRLNCSLYEMCYSFFPSTYWNENCTQSCKNREILEVNEEL